ncbi:hypothetical protein [Roseococcus thiosulfatophilus]|uniref:hypothetical protein n=1 Tax=Roseococcus thiosulfatophilus TaxID=35813 RepID=UPI001A8FCD67|nr:hypothetical protein [Roseococcus thiosulfatophilus]
MNITKPPGYANEPSRGQMLRDAMQDDRVHGALLLALEAERAQPSFVPGMSFEETAWREGRKSILSELIRMSEDNSR